jgi:cell division protein FtsW
MSELSARQATRLDAIRGRYDGWLIAIAGALACLGVVMVGSAGMSVGENQGVGAFHYLSRHVVFLAVGLGLAVWMMRMPLKTVEQYSQWLLLACFVLLLLVFIPGLGHSVNGAQRWIRVPGMGTFQAVEAVKLLYIVWLASYLKRYSDEVHADWIAMFKPLGVAVALVLTLLIQPDFGSSSLLLAITAGMLVLGGVNMPRMFGPAVVVLVGLAVVAIAEPYRVRRLTSFVDPFADPFGSGYQLANSLMAVGRGEWFGVGLGASVQKLSYLPEAHTDFILAVIAEELGFVGVCVVVALFAGLVGRAFWIGLQCVDMKRHFAGYCAFGVALWIALQSFVSIGVNLGLLPTKGLTLPLISSGGSSVLMTCMALGLLLRVSYELDRARRQVARARGEAPAPTSGAAASTSAPVTATVRPFAPVAAPVPAAARGTSRLYERIEPTFGRLA